MHDPFMNGHGGEKTRNTGRGKCSCCPYGYHLDLDFVRYCEKVANSPLLSQAASRQSRSSARLRPSLSVSRKKRESIESLLGLPTSPSHPLQEATEPWRKKRELITEKAFSDDLEKAVLDFEKIFKSSSKPQESVVRPVGNSANVDVKYWTIGGERTKTAAIEDLKLNGTNNASAVVLQEIRHQMAASLSRMRQLEEEVKIIPNLQNQLKKMRWENRRLLKLLESQEAQIDSPEKKMLKNDSRDVWKEKSPVLMRTIGTGCRVLQRDVGTMGLQVVTCNVGTEPSSPGLRSTAHKETCTSSQSRSMETLTEFSCESHSDRLALEKRVVTSNASAQTTQWRNFTLDSGTQTDLKPLRVSTMDFSAQFCPTRSLLVSSASQCEVHRSADFSSQADIPSATPAQKFTLSSASQTECATKHLVATSSTQTEKKTETRTKKHVGVQYKTSCANVGVAAKVNTDDSSSQTSVILKSDVGLVANTLPPCPVTKHTGMNTECKTSTMSRPTDTADLLRHTNASVNTTKVNLVNTFTETSGLIDTVEEEEGAKLKKEKPAKKITSKLSETKIPTLKSRSSLQQLEINEKHVEPEKPPDMSLDIPPSISKPYEKKEPSKEMKGALKVLNDNLLQSPSGEIPKNVRNAVNIVQQEWFKISSTADANPLDVEDYLDCFEELSVNLLEHIVNMTDISGNTAMHYAVSNGNFDVVSILLDSKVCNINKLNTAGYTCIMLVALTKVKSEADRQVVRRLFHMADVNIRARQHGQTALMLAVSHGRIDTVELLLESGADINIQDEDGSTALMCAAEHGYIDIVKLLLAQPDCDLSVTDLDGNTALNIAMEAGNRDIGVLLYAQEHFSRGASPFSSLRMARRAKSATPTLRTPTSTTPTLPCEHSL